MAAFQRSVECGLNVRQRRLLVLSPRMGWACGAGRRWSPPCTVGQGSEGGRRAGGAWEGSPPRTAARRPPHPCACPSTGLPFGHRRATASPSVLSHARREPERPRCPASSPVSCTAGRRPPPRSGAPLLSVCCFAGTYGHDAGGRRGEGAVAAGGETSPWVAPRGPDARVRGARPPRPPRPRPGRLSVSRPRFPRPRPGPRAAAGRSLGRPRLV